MLFGAWRWLLSRLAYVSNVESHLVASKDCDCPDVDRFFRGLGYWRFHVNGRKLKQKFSDLAGITKKLQPSMQAAIKHVFLMLVSAMLS